MNGDEVPELVEVCGAFVAVCSFLRLSSIASAASFSTFIAKATSGRPSRDEVQHLVMKFHTSSKTHSFGADGRVGRSPVTTLYMIIPSLAPGKGCISVITSMLPSGAVPGTKYYTFLTWYVVIPNA